ncbi:MULTISPECIES: PRC-barrel domain-containing protein [Bacillaceae]|uniref:Photosystem reaction center subunit H n=1 Tax=Bacillus infantis TaxID=324767 RepID=A0A5D4SV94_9BACI|nr:MULTISPECIES: PRC-barrel domain-containing protein [Bacillus]MCA1036409.1 PRC-barrel domain-containing protein [Bacillus infantis]MCP1159965.1 PRC-barrel domain-containing protein [Bacillus infantis]MDW2875793.1 PRC-barrel domain-containing protein [Bacillus infantis]TYS66142.1 photosystem reaction center subunit H [Bacillus infantis]
MKTSLQITGLPIISISDGQQVGKVKSLVINPEKGSIDFLTIEHEDWQVSVKAIPFKKVVGIGEYAVTVESDNAVIDLNEIPIANQLVNKKIRITNTKVMTRKGELIGEISEFYVDDETGNILGMDIKSGGSEQILRSDFVLTYGKDIVIVKEDAADGFLIDAALLDPNQSAHEKNNEAATEAGSSFENDEEIQLLKEKQVELLSGKAVLKDIYGMNGEVIISQGTILTREIINKAQEEGPNIVVELSMNVEA